MSVSGGQTTLVSTGPAGGNGAFGAFFGGASADGTRVFFETGESLVSADTDAALDVYERVGWADDAGLDRPGGRQRRLRRVVRRRVGRRVRGSSSRRTSRW